MLLMNALIKLGYQGVVLAEEISYNRYSVTVNGEYIGIWDDARRTFVD